MHGDDGRQPPGLSVVLSFRNEADVIPELLRRLRLALAPIGIRYELIFVNDASTDASLTLLAADARMHGNLVVITMSRPFGPTECAIAGLEFSKGAAVVLMDADLQDPPEVIPTLVDRWHQGADVVYTVRTARRGDGLLKSFATRAAYRLIRAVANIELPVEAGDYRLMSRRVVDELVKLPERAPYLRGLVAWVGFRQVPVYYERQPRFAGRTHFPWVSRNPWRTFLSGLTSFSAAPVLALLPLGIAICLTSAAAAVSLRWLPAWRTSFVLMGLGVAALGGLQLAGLGLLAVYVARIDAQVRGRPRYIVESVVAADGAPGAPPSAL